MEVEHMTQCLDWKWYQLDYTSSRETRIIKTRLSVFQMEKTAFIWPWCSKMLILHTFNAEVVSWFNQGEVIN